jgi:hypothetical protein
LGDFGGELEDKLKGKRNCLSGEVAIITNKHFLNDITFPVKTLLIFRGYPGIYFYSFLPLYLIPGFFLLC